MEVSSRQVLVTLMKLLEEKTLDLADRPILRARSNRQKFLFFTPLAPENFCGTM